MLRDFIVKGFALDDDRMKRGDSSYWKELLDGIFSAAGRSILSDAGSRSHREAMEKAEAEYRRYQVRTLSPVERAYLASLKAATASLPSGT